MEGFDIWDRPIGHAVRSDRVTGDVDAWRARRATYVGASEAASVLGVHPWKGPWAVWNGKVNGEPEVDNAAIRRGRRREPLILQDAADLLGVPVYRVPWVLRHPEVPALACNLDGLVEIGGEVCPVEAKWAGGHQAQHWKFLQDTGSAMAGTYVEMHTIQLQAQLAVTGLAAGYLVAECDLDCYLIRIPRCESTIAAIVSGVAGFWSCHVETKQAPPASSGDLDAITAAHPEAQAGLEVELSAEAWDDVQGYRKAAKEEKLAKAIKDAHKARICQALGDAESGTLPDGGRISWTNRSRKGTDWKALKADHPDLVAKYETLTKWRAIRV